MQKVHSNSPRTVSKTKTTYRDRIDLLRSRIGLLTGKDKLLMTMYMENGNSFRQLARLAGVCEANIARRISRITRRLLDGEYITCVRNRGRFTRTEMAIAKDCFLLGLSQRNIASKRRCSVHQVCKILKRVQEIIRTADNA
jgi:DNA-directed RNA polymerase specialized sigma subunit